MTRTGFLHRAAVALLLLATVAGCRRGEPAPETEAVVPVEVLAVTTVSRDETTAVTGVLEAYRAVDVISEVAAETRRIHHDVGDRVAAGDLLASLDRDVAREDLARAEATRLAAAARREIACNDFQRDSTLFATSDISTATFDNSRLQYRAAAAELKSADANLALARRQLDETDIRAPFAGYVSRRFCELGAYLSPGQRVFRLVDIDSLRLNLGVSQRDVPRLAAGAPVAVRCDALPGEVFRGRIRSISPEADPATRTFRVEVTLANPPGHPLRDGLVVNATLVLDSRRDVISIPREAVLYRGGEGYVYVVTDGRAERRTVGVGPLIDGEVVILRGLADGDRVVVVGQHNLRPGAPVAIETGGGGRGEERDS